MLPEVDIEKMVTITERLSAHKDSDLRRAAEIIKSGEVIAAPFNGVFGLFGDVDNIKAAEEIIRVKERPKDKKLIIVPTPERIHEFVDFSRIPHYPKERVIQLWKTVHALGIIFPASTHAPYHLTIGEGMERTILAIWTEYKPLRSLMQHAHKLGVRGLVGTSANKSGQGTHFKAEELWNEFRNDVRAVVVDNFDHLPEFRKKSTSVIDLTEEVPRLHREGNVSEDELRGALAQNNFPDLITLRDVITVRQRKV